MFLVLQLLKVMQSEKSGKMNYYELFPKKATNRLQLIMHHDAGVWNLCCVESSQLIDLQII